MTRRTISSIPISSRAACSSRKRARAAPKPPESVLARQSIPQAPVAEPAAAVQPAAPESPAVPQAAPGAAPPAGETQTAALPLATLPLDRFDGKWKWKKVDLDGACGSAKFRKLEIRGGTIEGSGRHPIGGFISVVDEVDEQGVVTMRGYGGSFKLQFTGRLTETEGSGQVDMTGVINCSGIWRVTKRSVN